MKTAYWTTLILSSALAIGCASKNKEDCDACQVGDVEDIAKTSDKSAAGTHDAHHSTGTAKTEENKETKDEKIEASALPAGVTAAFNTAHPGATIKEVEKETYPDGKIHYEIKYTDSTGEHEVELDEKGAAAH